MSGMAISNFAYVTLEKHIEMHAHSKHKEIKPLTEEEIENLKHWIKMRDEGAECIVCECSPIWAIGSAACGWSGCFTCITGESDASEDYEIR